MMGTAKYQRAEKEELEVSQMYYHENGSCGGEGFCCYCEDDAVAKVSLKQETTLSEAKA